MNARTKMQTTMGIELTFMPTCMQDMVNRLNPELDKEVDSVLSLSEQNAMCMAYSSVLERKLREASVPVKEVGRDPGCVEIPTNPYTTFSKLEKACRGVWREAKAIGLEPVLTSFNGGGAHIHTGMLGNTPAERSDYRARMAVFAMHNPWLCWAFAALEDTMNANPIHRDMSVSGSPAMDMQDVLVRIERARKGIIKNTIDLHRIPSGDSFDDRWRKRNSMDAIQRHTEKLVSLRKKYAGLRKTDVGAVSIRYIKTPGHYEKDFVIRATDYGKHGTIEFRAFEMPEKFDTLMRNVRFVNAIVKHVSEQTFSDVPFDSLPTKQQQDDMTWRQRRDGFDAMLDMLGMDRADFKAERVQIALRMRRYRTPKPKARTLGVAMDEAVRETSEALRAHRSIIEMAA